MLFLRIGGELERLVLMGIIDYEGTGAANACTG